MQGKEKYTPKLFVNFRLDEQFSANNFYRILKQKLDLNFVYKETAHVYSHAGRHRLHSVVFFRMLLVGYLENIYKDRKFT